MKQTEYAHYLSVVMPAYNEELHIKDNLLAASSAISKFCDSYRILAVNDGSTDNTKEEILKAVSLDKHIVCVSYDKNRGKGGAIAHGVKEADGRYIAFLDSDLELDPIMLRYFLHTLEKTHADIAIGSKMHKKSKLDYPFSRKILSVGYYIILKLLFNLNCKDTQTGIKLFSANVIKPICNDLRTNGFAFDIEILARASAKGYKILELPIQLKYSRSKGDFSKVNFKVIRNMFVDTLKIRKIIWDKKKEQRKR